MMSSRFHRRRSVVAALMTPAVVAGTVVAVEQIPTHSSFVSLQSADERSSSQTAVSAKPSSDIVPAAQFGPIFVPDQLVGALGSIIGSIVLSLLLRMIVNGGGDGLSSTSGMVSNPTDDEVREHLLAQINKERTSRGLQPVVLSEQGNKEADVWAKKLARDGKLSHDTDYAIEGALGAAENCSMGRWDQAHSSFMNSNGHRTNILRSEWNTLGIGVEFRGGIAYIVERFYLLPDTEGTNGDVPVLDLTPVND